MTRHRLQRAAPAILLILAASFTSAQVQWTGSWAASQQLVETPNALDASDLQDGTLRQIVHLSIGGSQLRVRISNRFGVAPLHVRAAHIAKAVSPGSAAIVPGTDAVLTFSGRPDVILPAGADYVSDPVTLGVPPLSDMAITLQVDGAPAQQTGHPGSRATSFIAQRASISAPDLPGAKKIEHWYFIAGVDVAGPAGAAAIVTLGDSITDGHGATTDGNDRWPDLLAKRLQAGANTQKLSVLNHGIGGNRLLLDGIGPNSLARFDHDVLAQAGARYLIVLEGINDIGMLTLNGDVPQPEHDGLVRGITGAYEQIVTRAHTHGITVIGATILPFVGSEFYHPGPATEADRQAINQWIRSSGHFDAVVDLDKVTRDPEHQERLLPAYDSGDHLHPSPAGFAAMADAFPLSLFSQGSAAAAPEIAITFDDLPVHAQLPPGMTRLEVASQIIAGLRDAHVPPTYGFVNGLPLQQQPADAAVLKAWVDAGNPLGNHTWSHMNLNQHTLQEFEAEVERNETPLTEWGKNGNWHWLRFPYLAEGDTPEKRAGIRNFLLQRGYKIAGVTMSFADYLYNDPYARCSEKKDTQAIALLEKTYIDAADESITYYRRLSHTLFGRDVPYVLLMHLGAFDARMLPRLLDLYRSRGFQFVTLEQAERDTFYKQDTDLASPAGPNNLEGTMGQRGLPVPPHSISLPDFNKLCQ